MKFDELKIWFEAKYAFTKKNSQSTESIYYINDDSSIIVRFSSHFPTNNKNEIVINSFVNDDSKCTITFKGAKKLLVFSINRAKTFIEDLIYIRSMENDQNDFINKLTSQNSQEKTLSNTDKNTSLQDKNVTEFIWDDSMMEDHDRAASSKKWEYICNNILKKRINKFDQLDPDKIKVLVNLFTPFRFGMIPFNTAVGIINKINFADNHINYIKKNIAEILGVIGSKPSMDKTYLERLDKKSDIVFNTSKYSEILESKDRISDDIYYSMITYPEIKKRLNITKLKESERNIINRLFDVIDDKDNIIPFDTCISLLNKIDFTSNDLNNSKNIIESFINNYKNNISTVLQLDKSTGCEELKETDNQLFNSSQSKETTEVLSSKRDVGGFIDTHERADEDLWKDFRDCYIDGLYGLGLSRMTQKCQNRIRRELFDSDIPLKDCISFLRMVSIDEYNAEDKIKKYKALWMQVHKKLPVKLDITVTKKPELLYSKIHKLHESCNFLRNCA